MQIRSAAMHFRNVAERRKGASLMGEVIGAIVFGLIGIAVLGAILYILGMLLTGPFILVDSAVKSLHHEGEHAHGRVGRVALHH